MGEILKNVVKDHLCHVWIGLAIKAARVDWQYQVQLECDLFFS